MANGRLFKIKIIRGGPYVVTGGVPLAEKLIRHTRDGYQLQEGRSLPQSEQYALCRCGRSRNAPFCDGTHAQAGFMGTETASMDKYTERARVIHGTKIDLMDDGRCAYARFCHRKNGTVWDLIAADSDPDNREEMVKGAGECLTGRLVARSKDGREMEPDLPPGIAIIQDPEYKVSAGIYVQGGIPVESADGKLYETRNRGTLCRCGKSCNTPFCDASHMTSGYYDDASLPANYEGSGANKFNKTPQSQNDRLTAPKA
jgi:CDGSH-type Zn-finger protein